LRPLDDRPAAHDVASACESVLAELVAAPGGKSGDGLAAWMQARAAVLAELRRRGHVLEEGDGFLRLACAAAHFDPQRFAGARTSHLGAALEVWEHAPSTNDLARAGDAASPAGQVWLAEQQTAGRGRQGRTWICAPHKGLLFSFRVESDLEPVQRPTLLPLAIGLGAARGVQAATGLDVRTKWPNDLWLDARKLGGVLVEARPGRGGWAVAGVGINCAPAAIAGTGLAHATTLRGGLRRETLLAAVLQSIEHALDDWRCGRFASLLGAWCERDVLLGTHVRVEAAGRTLTGRARAISALGLLGLELANGEIVEVAAGEVHTLP
jgi:BirA family biotin operon repressor/biotin-[acetyl-CoA-carboxylase] ligase